MLEITSSVIVAKALGLAPDGIEAEHECTCAYCGLHIKEGELRADFSAGQSFVDAQSLAAKGSPDMCGFCAVLMSKKALISTGYGTFHKGGVEPFQKWKHIAAALENPPEAPFVMTYATANNQHMAWRAPVNFSRDLYYVRVGLRDLKIRRQKMLSAVGTLQRMGKAIGRNGGPKSLAHPFSSFSSNLKIKIERGEHPPTFMPDVWEKCDPADIDEIMALTTGEIWAMCFLLTPGAGTKD